MILTAILVIPSVAMTVSADDHEDEREVSYVEGPDSFEAVSESSGFKVNDQFSIAFDEGTVTATYIGDPASSAVRDWQMELTFEWLVGFADNGDGVLDSADAVAWSHELEDWTFSVTSQLTPLPDGGNMSKVTALSENGILTLEFFLSTSPTVADSVPISPTDVKLNIKLDIDEEGGTFDSVALAIGAEVDYGSDIELQQQVDENLLNLTHGDMGGFFSWSKNATVDGTLGFVSSTWNGEVLTLIYPAGDVIIHDPIVGIRSVAALSGLVNIEELKGSPVLYLAGIALAAALVLGSILATKRTKD